jgi:hypothetical protein
MMAVVLEPSILDQLDQAIQNRRSGSAPAEHRSGVNTILEAFAAYESGNDQAVKSLIQGIGLTSPLSEWKLLLRGLIAYSAGEQSKALENFTHLKQNRLPFKLAKPIRAQLDSTFRQTLTQAEQNYFTTELKKLQESPLEKLFSKLQRELNPDKPLSVAFVTAEKIVRELRTAHPDLVEALTVILYSAIEHHGKFEDIARFVRLLGRPKFDPNFHRLEAIRTEIASDYEASVNHCVRYSEWLASSDSVCWPQQLANKMRARVLSKLASLISLRHHNILPESDFEGIRITLELAHQLDPDAEPIALQLFDYYLRVNDTYAVSHGDAFLKKHPSCVKLIQRMLNLTQRAQLHIPALDYARQLLLANPLDQNNREIASNQVLLTVRHFAVIKRIDEAKSLLKQESALLLDQQPAAYHAAQVIFAMREKDEQTAANAMTQLTATAGPGLVSASLLSWALGLGLKPAQRKPYEEQVAETWRVTLRLPDAIKGLKHWLSWKSSSEVLPFRGYQAILKRFEETVSTLFLLAQSPEIIEVEYNNLVMSCSTDLSVKIGKLLIQRPRPTPSVVANYAEVLLNHPKAKRADIRRAIDALIDQQAILRRNRESPDNEHAPRIEELITRLLPRLGIEFSLAQILRRRSRG